MLPDTTSRAVCLNRISMTCKNCPYLKSWEQLVTDDLTMGLPTRDGVDLRFKRDPLLVEREKTHGSFGENAHYSQQLKTIFNNAQISHSITFDIVQREALDMIALKLSRILSGQANFKDHWLDLSGYSLLAAEACDK